MEIQYSRVSTKGQVVIPAELRQTLGLRSGNRIALQLEGHAILLQPITEDFIDSIPGSLKGPSLGAVRDRDHRSDKR